jgi:hypothetical protein
MPRVIELFMPDLDRLLHGTYSLSVPLIDSSIQVHNYRSRNLDHGCLLVHCNGNQNITITRKAKEELLQAEINRPGPKPWLDSRIPVLSKPTNLIRLSSLGQNCWIAKTDTDIIDHSGFTSLIEVVSELALSKLVKGKYANNYYF